MVWRRGPKRLAETPKVAGVGRANGTVGPAYTENPSARTRWLGSRGLGVTVGYDGLWLEL